jgi:uncharacterized membrane protein YdbT with pleckstrin-like domain
MTEQPLDTFRSSTLGWLRGTLAGLGTALLLVLGVALTVAGVGVAQTGITWLPPLLTLVALVILAVVWVKNLAATYEVTAERLIIRTGILFKAVDEIELYRIKDVRLNFTLLNQWAGIGTLSISSSDETTRDGDLVIPHVAKAQARREHLRRLVDTARQKRQVREIDMAHEHP